MSTLKQCVCVCVCFCFVCVFVCLFVCLLVCLLACSLACLLVSLFVHIWVSPNALGSTWIEEINTNGSSFSTGSGVKTVDVGSFFLAGAQGMRHGTISRQTIQLVASFEGTNSLGSFSTPGTVIPY